MKIKQKITCHVVGAVFMLISTPVFATNLLDVYLKAVQCDPIFEAARATRLANKEAIPQSLSTLLPNLVATANTTLNAQNILSIQGFQSTVLNPTNQLGTIKYNSNGYSVTLTQPLVAPVNWMKVSVAKAQGKQADATFAAAAQDLMIRVAKAYFDALFAQDDLSYTEAEQAANARQLKQVKERFDVGLDPITSVYNAQASYDAATARVIAAKNTLRDKFEELRRLTGQCYDCIEGFKIEIPLLTPQPICIEDWVTAARNMNLPYLASRYAVAAARSNVKVFFAGHFPTLNAVGNVTRANGQSYGLIDASNASAALQLNVPIFQGGFVSSQTRQAEDQYAKAAADMVDFYRKAVVETRQRFDDVMSGINLVRADREAVFSAQSSVSSTEESFKVGMRTIVDVLIAQRQLFEAQRTYAKDEYEYLLNTLLLKQAAGTLSPLDIVKINCWLQNGKTVSPPPFTSSESTVDHIADAYSEKGLQKTFLHKPVVRRPLTHHKAVIPFSHQHIAHQSVPYRATMSKHPKHVALLNSLTPFNREHISHESASHKVAANKHPKHVVLHKTTEHKHVAQKKSEHQHVVIKDEKKKEYVKAKTKTKESNEA